jgi:aconitase B
MEKLIIIEKLSAGNYSVLVKTKKSTHVVWYSQKNRSGSESEKFYESINVAIAIRAVLGKVASNETYFTDVKSAAKIMCCDERELKSINLVEGE